MEKSQIKENKDIKKYFIPVISGILLTFLFGFTIWIIFHYSPAYIDNLIADDIVKLKKIFQKINRDCKIINFKHTKNYIDFLNVEKFVGSEVGSLDLAHPEKWSGPYLHNNPVIQEQLFQIIKTKKGNFIVPGEGIKIGNKKIIGKDIIFDENSDIENMMRKPSLLFSSGRTLAAKLEFVDNTSQENIIMPLIEDEDDPANI